MNRKEEISDCIYNVGCGFSHIILANIIDALVRLKIDREEAKGLTFCRRGYQYISHSCVVQRAISNSRLKKRGLLDPLEYYLKEVA